MAWKKSSPELIDRFKGALPDDPALVPKAMFGYPASFVRGNFFMGLFEEKIVIRMPEPQRSKLKALARAGGFSPMAGKSMADWYEVPSPIAASAKDLSTFVKDALVLAKELPEKKKAPGKKKSKK